MPHRPHLVFEPEIQDALSQYIVELYVDETDAQRQISEKTTTQGLPQIDLRAEEGWMLMFLTRLIQAKQVVEIGTLAGYSATWIARGLPDDGKLITLELDPKHANIARENLDANGVSHKVDILVGDATQNLKTLNGPFDLVFIDADKEGYEVYLDWAINHVRKGGLITAHNAFQQGNIVAKVPDPHRANGAKHIDAFNRRVAADKRLLSTIIPVGDGLVAAMVL